VAAERPPHEPGPGVGGVDPRVPPRPPGAGEVPTERPWPDPSGAEPIPDTATPHEPAATDGAGPVDDAHQDVAQLVAERDQYLDGMKRLKAEFDNYRKRAERDRLAQAASVEQELIKSLLPVLDNLERAVVALDQVGDVSTGVDMVRVQLGDVLAGRGLAKIEADGAQFDPYLHEAVATVPTSDAAPGTIVEVVQTGYTLGETVVRPSTVVVAAKA
jgi:molecular chaperone GrpE